MSRPPVRVLYAGADADGPHRLRDSGHEVVFVGADASATLVAAVAEQEDVELVAVEDADLGGEVAAEVDGDVVVFSVTSPTRPS